MYAHASDEASGTLVGVFSGNKVSDAQYEQSLAVMNRADLDAASRGAPFIYVVVVDNDVPRPPAVWRKRFSDANYGVKSERFFFVMVTTSMLIRGVYTAVNWVTEKRTGHEYGVVSSIEEAERWLQWRGASAPELVQLERRARRELSPERATDARSR